MKNVLMNGEVKQLPNDCVTMAEQGHGLITLTTLKMKVSKVTMHLDMPFRNGIPGGGWMRGRKYRHP